MKRDEKLYFAALEKLVRDEKRNSIFFSDKSDSFALDIELLMRHLQKNDPDFIEHMYDQYIDTTQLKGFKNVNEVRELVANMKKGSVVKWSDGKGNELYYVNQGRNIMTGKKQIYVTTANLSKKDVKALRKSFMEKILKKDLETVYKKIQKEQQLKKGKKLGLLKRNLVITQDYKNKELENIGTGFEKQFKKVFKEVGSASVDPNLIAATMIHNMSKGEQRDIAAAFSTFTESGFKSLLNKWKDEALGYTPSVSRNKNTIEDGMSR